MGPIQIDITEFVQLLENNTIIDVRSPSEFSHAHIPSAYSLPLFTDEERKVVGTTYKQSSRAEAIKIGLDFFGPKMKQIVIEVEALIDQKTSKQLIVHCWRGGMRSVAVAWLLDIYGFKVYTLKGGYKAFRNWVLSQFILPYNLMILTGYTGSGKTEILKELANKDQCIIDLEGLAKHKGSTFGALGMPAQPSSEQFENDLALMLYRLSENYPEKCIWLEGENSRIGGINLPHLFFNQMKAADCIHIEVPFEKRLDKIVQEYGCFDKEELKKGALRIQKRLGGLATQQVLTFLDEGKIKKAFAILMKYYDRTYEHNQLFSSPSQDIYLPDANALKNAALLNSLFTQ